jgi:hypothetical protein
LGDSHPEATGLAIVGSVGLLGSTFVTWFAVLVQYPTDESLVRYGIFGPAYGSLHDYSAFGRAFEVLTVLAGIAALLAILYGTVAASRMDAVANILMASGAVAFSVLVIAWITFEIADPLGNATGGDVRLGLGAVLAGLSAGGILGAGLFLRRDLRPDHGAR